MPCYVILSTSLNEQIFLMRLRLEKYVPCHRSEIGDLSLKTQLRYKFAHDV